MEETQTRDPGNVVLSDARWAGGALAEAVPRLSLRLCPAADLDAALGETRGVLGVVAFGARPVFETGAFPFVWVDMPALGSDSICEIWQSDEPIELIEAHGVRAARNAHLVFGALQVPEEGALEDAARVAYERVFAALDAFGFPHLLRVWNYFPDINADADGIERYRLFNVGRHEAFAARGRTNDSDMPAACALGCRSGPLTLYFMAANEPGRPVENPRQVSAYRYPPRYGPRTPAFSRAMLMQRGAAAALAISGTASIVGHETQHVDDAAAQIDETLRNIAALIDTAGFRVDGSPQSGAGLLLKAYLRREQDLDVVERALARTYPAATVVYFKADVCRSDLLVEVEGFYCPPA